MHRSSLPAGAAVRILVVRVRRPPPGSGERGPPEPVVGPKADTNGRPFDRHALGGARPAGLQPPRGALDADARLVAGPRLGARARRHGAARRAARDADRSAAGGDRRAARSRRPAGHPRPRPHRLRGLLLQPARAQPRHAAQPARSAPREPRAAAGRHVLRARERSSRPSSTATTRSCTNCRATGSRSRTCAAASRTTCQRRSSCRRASTTASRPSPARRSSRARAGRTSSTSGPTRGRRGCTSRASSS